MWTALVYIFIETCNRLADLELMVDAVGQCRLHSENPGYFVLGSGWAQAYKQLCTEVVGALLFWKEVYKQNNVANKYHSLLHVRKIRVAGCVYIMLVLNHVSGLKTDAA